MGLPALLCFGFGLGHLTGFFGPGQWTSDSFGIIGSPRLVKPVYSVVSLSTSSYGVISSNHILGGFFGICVSVFHVVSRPGRVLYKLLNMGNLEGVLSLTAACSTFSVS